MATCPCCFKEIDNVDYVSREDTLGYLDADGDYTTSDVEPVIITIKFYCPECRSYLFDSMAEAEKFIERV